MLAPQLDPIVSPLPYSLLFRNAFSPPESIPLVSLNTAGKVAPIIGIVFALHGDLFTGVELWRPADSKHECRVQHGAFQGRSLQRHKAARIMIVKECRHPRRITRAGVVLQLIA